MKEKILVVEDEVGLLRAIQVLLEQAGYEVYTAENGMVGLRTFYETRPNLVLLDIAMPEMDGLTLCKRIREVNEQVPVVMLTAQSKESDIVKGLEAGADDYIPKPFKTKELLARIAAVLRRQHAWATATEQPLTYADNYLSVDLQARQIIVQGKAVRLTPTEYKLLTFLIRHAGQLLSIQQILENVWGYDYVDAIDYPRVYIWHLRKKIEPDPANPRYLLSEPGTGYCFSPQH